MFERFGKLENIEQFFGSRSRTELTFSLVLIVLHITLKILMEIIGNYFWLQKTFNNYFNFTFKKIIGNASKKFCSESKEYNHFVNWDVLIVQNPLLFSQKFERKSCMLALKKRNVPPLGFSHLQSYLLDDGLFLLLKEISLLHSDFGKTTRNSWFPYK